MASATFEPFSDWLEEKIDLPIFEEFHAPKEPIVQDTTQSLLLEFESVCGTIGVNNSNAVPQLFTHLTPPQSPPGGESPHASGQFFDDAIPQYVQNATPAPNQFYWQPIVADIAKELATVDDIVNRAAQNLDVEAFPEAYVHHITDLGKSHVPSASVSLEEEDRDEDEEDSSSPSPCSPSSSSCSTYGSSENDDEWYQPAKSSAKTKSARSKPYARHPEDKKSRKKEQNKNAATRYRQKKKAEIEILMEEEKELQVKNGQLQTRYTELKREVSYIKGLLRELFKIKGLIK